MKNSEDYTSKDWVGLSEIWKIKNAKINPIFEIKKLKIQKANIKEFNKTVRDSLVVNPASSSRPRHPQFAHPIVLLILAYDFSLLLFVKSLNSR